jgi:hypothetical protein
VKQDVENGLFLGVIATVMIALCVHSCGFLGSKGDEPKGDESLPLSGVGPFLKQDQNCQEDFIQPILMDSGDPLVYWGEPFLMPRGGTRYGLFFEARGEGSVAIYHQFLEITPAPQGSCRSRDVYFVSRDGELTPRPDPDVVMEAAGAPTVIRDQDLFKVWYEMGNGQGIGYAEAAESDEGFHVLYRVEPVVQPSEQWESDVVGSPTVLWNEGLGLYQMWYEGDISSERSIGYATSIDGKEWTKRDAAGHTSKDHQGSVSPVLTPTQITWEYHYPAEHDSGSIGTPHVILHRTPVRTLYYLYYTGNLRGKEALGSDDVDSSIGLAGSEDGLHWVKASTLQEFGNVAWEVNPILNEVFALDVVDKFCREIIELWDEDYKEKIRGSSNVFCPLVIVDEMAPGVLDMGTFFLMVYQQRGGLDQSKGIALAALERRQH